MGRRIEIAHFWQEVCLSIAVYRMRGPQTAARTSTDQWLDAGPTQIRVRSVDEVQPMRRDWAPLEWCPFVFVLVCIVGTALAGSSEPGDESAPPMRVASILETVGRPCARGDVLVVTNEMPWTSLDVGCWDPTVNTQRVLGPGESLRASPDALASCWFSDGTHSWSYPLAISPEELARQRPRPPCDPCAPYLFHFEIDGQKTLRIAFGESVRFSRLPMGPSFVD